MIVTTQNVVDACQETMNNIGAKDFQTMQIMKFQLEINPSPLDKFIQLQELQIKPAQIRAKLVQQQHLMEYAMPLQLMLVEASLFWTIVTIQNAFLVYPKMQQMIGVQTFQTMPILKLPLAILHLNWMYHIFQIQKDKKLMLLAPTTKRVQLVQQQISIKEHAMPV